MLNFNSVAIAIVSLAVAGFVVAPQALDQQSAHIFRENSQSPVFKNPVISTDGAWVAAEERSGQGDGNVPVWSAKGDMTFTIEHGQNPRISHDSRWVSALQKPADSTTGDPKNRRNGQTLVLLDLHDGSRRTFDFVLSYDVTYTSSYLLYYQSPEMNAGERDKATKQAAKPVAEEPDPGTLHAVHLLGDKVFTIKNVTQYVPHLTHSNHQTNDHFAYVLHDEDTGRDTLYMALLNPGRDKQGNYGIRGTYVGNRIEGLRWTSDNATAVFPDQSENANKAGGSPVSALYTWHDVPGRAGQRVFTRVDNRK